MKALLFVSLVVSLLGMVSSRHADGADQPRTPVLLELFTSEGCSSCPPADRVTAELLAKQPVPEAEVVPLAWHVDYWNYIGWTDPYSSKQYTARQKAYVAAMNLRSMYTPQIIIDGTDEFVGSDRPQALERVKAAAKAPKANVSIAFDDASAKDLIILRIRVTDLPRADNVAEVVVALAEDELKTRVPRGENAGKTLEHVAVVRTFQRMALEKDSTELTARLRVDPTWKRGNLRVVAFVQEAGPGRVLGVATARP